MRLSRLGAALTIVILLSFALPATADHEQTASGKTVVFDHKAGNEWWVELLLRGASSGDVTRVEVQAYKDPWAAMQWRADLGSWALSKHFPSGLPVKFRAAWADGTQIESCWFSHPQGVESCQATDPEPSSFDATFTLVTGNEWWVQSQVTPNSGHTVSSVDVRLNGGSWMPLKPQSWGVRAWAASYHIVDGTVVQLRATSTTGASDLSSCYQWIPPQTNGETARVVPCTTDPEGPFDASFSSVRGNEWWVQAYVAANAGHRIASVDVRLNAGDWKPLKLQSWGSWAASYHIVDGTQLQLRATSTTGATELSECYRWIPPQDQEAPRISCGSSPPPPSTTDVAFGPKAGNEWWVETLVVANGTISRVDARANGGAWHAMTLRSWGAWAASFHVPAGSSVEFRATTSQGTDTSHAFRWPAATLIGGDGTWPEEGSYVRYQTRASDPAPSTTEGTETLIYHGGAWWSFAEYTTTFGWGQVARGQHFCADARLPQGPTGVNVGDNVTVEVGTCFNNPYDVTVRQQDSHAARQNGDAVTMQTWYAQRIDSCNCREWVAEWDRDMGLLAYSNLAGRGSDVMSLEDTDAPIR